MFQWLKEACMFCNKEGCNYIWVWNQKGYNAIFIGFLPLTPTNVSGYCWLFLICLPSNLRIFYVNCLLRMHKVFSPIVVFMNYTLWCFVSTLFFSVKKRGIIILN
jgi:hypothetical protein